MRTLSPCLCTWMRAPSSFHSNAASPPSWLSASADSPQSAQASAQSATRISSRNAASPALPSRKAASATGPSVCRVHHGRAAHFGDRQFRGSGDGIDHHALERALAQFAEHAGGAGNPARRAVARPNRSRKRRGAQGTHAGPAQSRDLRDRPVDLRQGQRRGAGGLGRAASRSTAGPMPMRPCGASPERYWTPILISGGSSERRNAARARTFSSRAEVMATRS